jgi:hypothetical protein
MATTIERQAADAQLRAYYDAHKSAFTSGGSMSVTDMIKPTHQARRILQRSAHDEPHHQFDALRTCLSQIFRCRIFISDCGSGPIRIRNWLSQTLLMSPARGPCN